MTDIEQRVTALEKQVAALVAKQPADASELNGERGDPEVRNDVKSWKGPSFKGKRFSQCPPEFLDALASLLDWKAGKEDEENKVWTSKTDASVTKPMSQFTRRDAGLARGWAKRLRESPAPVSDAAGDAADPLPF